MIFSESTSIVEIEESTDITKKEVTQLKLNLCKNGDQDLLELVRPNKLGVANADYSCEKNKDKE